MGPQTWMRKRYRSSTILNCSMTDACMTTGFGITHRDFAVTAQSSSWTSKSQFGQCQPCMERYHPCTVNLLPWLSGGSTYWHHAFCVITIMLLPFLLKNMSSKFCSTCGMIAMGSSILMNSSSTTPQEKMMMMMPRTVVMKHLGTKRILTM